MLNLRIVFAALFLPSLALAAGGPIGGGATPNGGLSPVDLSQVRLLREKLTIRAGDSGHSFHARAEYVAVDLPSGERIMRVAAARGGSAGAGRADGSIVEPRS